MDSSQIEFDIGLGDDTGMIGMQLSTDNCHHPINFGNMCGVCGVYLSDEQIANSAPMTHDGDGVKVSTQEAKRLDTESTAHLLGQRKLALVIDLDQTIIHATVDRSVGEFMNDTSNPNHQVLKDVGKFFLGADGREMKFEEEEEQKQEQESKQDKGKGKEKVNGKDNTSSSNSSSKSKNKDQSSNSTSPSVEAKIRRATLEGGMWYYVKPRPHLNSFLETLSKKYQLHVYTMGTRSYADCVCKLIDRDGKFFGNRILSRDESGSIQRKSLARLFADTSMVVAIDDRADVWEYSPNLVKVVPFSFFPATGDINGAFLPPVPEAPTGAPSTPLPQTEASQSLQSPSDHSLSSDASSSSSSTLPSPATSSTSLGEDSSSIPISIDSGNQDQDPETAKQVQTQQIALNEQRENRPLARMQQAKDEKLKNEGSTNTEVSNPSQGQSEKGKEKEKSQESVVEPEENSKGESGSDADGKAATGSGNETEGDKNTEIEGEDDEDDDDTMSSDSSVIPVVNLNDIAATTRAVLSDDDRELDRLEKILLEVHSRWYLEWDSVESSRTTGNQTKSTEQEMLEAAMRPKPKVEDIIGSLKSIVLRGCGIVFSSMWPLETDPVNTEVWRMAEDFGAKCYLELNKAVTHVVAAKELTEKVKLGQRHKSISVVWPTWFNESIASWTRIPEQDYLLPIPFEISNNKRTPSPLPDPPLISATQEAEDRLIMAALAAEQEAGNPFAFEMDRIGEDEIGQDDGEGSGEGEGMAGFAWDEAADEVNAFLSDDDDDEDTDGGGYATDASNRSRTKGKSVKRGRNSTGGFNGNHSRSTSGASTDNDEENGSSSSDKSPLSKRRKLAKSRSGLSKLKESETIHSGNESDQNDDRRKSDGNKTGSEFGDEENGEDMIAASQDTDGSEIDQSFLRQLEDDLELELGEDGSED